MLEMGSEGGDELRGSVGGAYRLNTRLYTQSEERNTRGICKVVCPGEGWPVYKWELRAGNGRNAGGLRKEVLQIVKWVYASIECSDKLSMPLSYIATPPTPPRSPRRLNLDSFLWQLSLSRSLCLFPCLRVSRFFSFSNCFLSAFYIHRGSKRLSSCAHTIAIVATPTLHILRPFPTVFAPSAYPVGSLSTSRAMLTSCLTALVSHRHAS